MLSLDQRKLLAAKLADFGNIAAGSLIFGILVREEAFTQLSILLGLLLLGSAYAVAIVLIRRVS